jgi:bifunctional non-homologous end joining protein LigD
MAAKTDPTVKSAKKKSAPKLVRGKDSMPADLLPMLATLVSDPLEKPGWLYEVKWDGYRAIGYVDDKSVQLRSRNNKSFNEKFYPIVQALKDWGIQAVVDGEVIVVNDKGISDFSALQGWRSEADGELQYYLFDLLWHDRTSLMDRPLEERRKQLAVILPDSDIIKMSKTFESSGNASFELADKMGLEGVIAKKADSRYVPGQRSKDWLKIKTEKHQEAIICGYTKNENTPKPFSALLLGLYDGGELQFIGPVGTGFSVSKQEEILKRLKPLKTKRCPFKIVPEYNKPSRFRPDPPKAEVFWVKPELVVEIRYAERTRDGAIRHPSFRGFRDDKKADDVHWETAAVTSEVTTKEEGVTKNAMFSAAGKKERKTLLNPTDETQVRAIKGHELKFTNLSKVYWPEEGYTKRDMINYYYQVVPYMLPYMKDRPQTLNRYPNGIYGESFYQKDVTGKAPSWIETFGYFSHHDQREKQFLVATDEASLLYIASLGCIEMNPWSSRTQKPDHPDWCIIDLDPDGNPFNQVIETANVTKKLLDAIGVPSYCKTSGSTGLHIYIPLGAKYTYEESKEFGRALVKQVHAGLPKFTSVERLTTNRKGKLYLDFLQNRPQATVAAPYSLRPKPGATVSMPLEWEEVKKGLKMKDFTIKNAVARLKQTGDLFKGVLGRGINMQKALKKLEEITR